MGKGKTKLEKAITFIKGKIEDAYDSYDHAKYGEPDKYREYYFKIELEELNNVLEQLNSTNEKKDL